MTTGSRDRSFNVNYQLTITTPTGVVVTPSSSRISRVDSWSGSDSPRWKSQIKAGGDATNPYSAKRFGSFERDYGFWRVQMKCDATGGVSPSGKFIRDETLVGGFCYYVPTVANLPSGYADANTRASAKAISQIVALQHQFAGSQFLGELRDTLHLLRNPATSILNATKQYLTKAKAIKRSSKRPLKTLSDAYLEYAFGIAPLIADTKSAAEALSELINGRPRIERFVASHSVYDRNVQSFNELVSPNYFYSNSNIVTDNVYSVRFVGGVKVQAKGSTLANTMDIFGFTPDQFVPTLWEILPWSWLADYFLNVGDVLQGTFYSASSIAWCSRTTRNVTTSIKTMSLDVGSVQRLLGASYSASAGSPVRQRASVSQISRSSSFPSTPSLTFRLPKISNIPNIAAVLGQRASFEPFRRSV